MALPRLYSKNRAKAKQRQRFNAHTRHQQQQRHAQRDIHALHDALHALGLPDTLVVEIAGRLRAQKKLLGKVFGLINRRKPLALPGDSQSLTIPGV